MLREFPMMQGNLLPELETVLEDASGPINLTGMTVKFVMVPWNWTLGQVPKIDRAVTILDAPAGRVKYSWQGTDTDTIGDGPWEAFRGVFHVTSGSLVFSVPNGDYIYIPIIADLRTP